MGAELGQGEVSIDGPTKAKELGHGTEFSPSGCFVLFCFYFPFLFQIQFKPCLNSKFQIYAQEKLYMMHNFYIIFIYSVILFRLGFQHEVHTPHYYFEC